MRDLWSNLKTIGSNIRRGGRDIWSKVKTIGKPILNITGKILGGAKTVAGYIDKSPLADIIRVSPFAPAWEIGKKGLNIADELRQSGERILDGDNVIQTVKNTLPKIGVGGRASNIVGQADAMQDAIRNKDFNGVVGTALNVRNMLPIIGRSRVMF